MFDIKKLKVNPKNPRQIDPEKFELLKKSILEFPKMLEYRPVCYDENYMILGGQRRYEAIVELSKNGFEIKDEYFYQIKGLTELQKDAFTIKDNGHAGEWDLGVLKDKWSKHPLNEWGIDFLGTWEKPKEPSDDVGDGSSKNKEIDPNHLMENPIQCPHCGFEFEVPKE